MGGSLGSKKLNSIIRENLEALQATYQIIHLTGKGLIDEQYSNQKDYIQFDFVKDDLTDLLAITDTVISRAGSNAIYEFLALRIPMLLIPLGLEQSRGDQIDNAENFEAKGFGKTIPENDLTEQKLIDQLNNIEANRDVIINQMQTYKESFTRQDLFRKIIKDALS
ncbi:glycosyltransferase [Staphylococcus shinii]